MNKSSHTKSRLAAALLALAAAPGLATAANVGYYDTCLAAGNPSQAASITAAGHTPINVATPNAAGLATLDVLFVQNCSNGNAGSNSAEYLANFTDITNAVAGGLVLVVHDRWVTGAASLVPGAGAISFTRDTDIEDADINFPIGSPILTGPGGTLTDTSLDGGNSSSHGFVTLSTLPPGGSALAVRPTSSQGVTVTWGHGAGRVVYSTIPLDYYLLGNNPISMRDVYAPNIIHWAAGGVSFTTCAAEGFTADKLKLCKMICEIPQTPAVRAELTRLWVIKTGTPRPCP